MKSEVAAIADTRHHGVGNRTDANLDRRTIFDITADMACDRALALTNRPRLQSDGGPRNLNQIVNPVRSQIRVAMSPGRLLVDLGDNDSRLWRSRPADSRW